MNSYTFNWKLGFFLISYQVLVLLSLPFYFYYAKPSGALIGISLVLSFLVKFSVTGGNHRYFSHKSYKVHPIIELMFLLLSTMSLQGSTLRWAYDHRLHHAHADTNKDPYMANKGFWHAHFLWILYKPDAINPKLVSDLLKNPRVVFQHRFIIPLMFGTNALAWLFVGWLLNDYLGAFFIAVVLRIFLLHHFTWLINSLSHRWGDKPFCQEQTATNSLIISFLTLGEGYHNYHHIFAKDYRSGACWYHFDPTKWCIWTLSKLGLAKHLRKVDALIIKKRMVLERKALLLEKLTYAQREHLKKEVQLISDKIVEKIESYSTQHKELCKLKQPALIAKVHEEIDHLRSSLKKDWKKWKLLSKAIKQSNRDL